MNTPYLPNYSSSDARATKLYDKYSRLIQTPIEEAAREALQRQGLDLPAEERRAMRKRTKKQRAKRRRKGKR